MPKQLRVIFALILSLVLVACAQTGSGPDYRNEVGANGLLTPRAIFARYVDALGGEDTLRSHRSKRMSGAFDLVAFGVSGEMEMITAEPNLVVQNIELEALGNINSGYNGEVAWSSNPMQGTIELTGAMLDDMARQAEYYLPMTYADVFPQQETVQETTINGEAAYEVLLVDSARGETTAFFSTESGLMLRTETTVNSPVGPMETQTDLFEYEMFDGENIPTSLSVNQAGQQIEIQVDAVSYNDVDDADFAAPAGL